MSTKTYKKKIVVELKSASRWFPHLINTFGTNCNVRCKADLTWCKCKLFQWTRAQLACHSAAIFRPQSWQSDRAGGCTTSVSRFLEKQWSICVVFFVFCIFTAAARTGARCVLTFDSCSYHSVCGDGIGITLWHRHFGLLLLLNVIL